MKCLWCILPFVLVSSVYGDSNAQILDGCFRNVFTKGSGFNPPEVISFKNELNLITESGIRLILDENQRYIRKPDVKVVPSPVRELTDPHGTYFEISLGKLNFVSKHTGNRAVQIITRQDHVVTRMSLDPENDVLYLLSSYHIAEQYKKKYNEVFAFKTTRVKITANFVFAEPILWLGDKVISMAVNEKTGDLALAIKTETDWKLQILKRLKSNAETIIDEYCEEIQVTTTTTTEMASIKTTKVSDKVVTNLKNVRLTVLTDLEKAKLLYEDYYYRSEMKYENLMKRYLRTLKLTQMEEFEMRKNYPNSTHSRILAENIKKLLDRSIWNLDDLTSDISGGD